MNNRIAYYGWQPDMPDHRDLIYSAPRAVLRQLPSRIDLRDECPPVYDQGHLGSCTANAIGAAIEFGLMKQQANVFMPSRLFIYYNERVVEGTVLSDAGAQLKDGIKSVNKQGVCPEPMCPYVIERFTDEPTPEAYAEAKHHCVTSYERIARGINQMKGCLAEGFPFIFGFTVYESFESDETATTGKVNMPSVGEHLMGGHAVVAVGYDDGIGRFIVRNSWGSDWGMKGYFTMPYDYLLDPGLARDFWTIRLMLGEQR